MLRLTLRLVDWGMPMSGYDHAATLDARREFVSGDTKPGRLTALRTKKSSSPDARGKDASAANPPD